MTALEGRICRSARAALLVLAVIGGAAVYAWLLRVGLVLTFAVWLPYWQTLVLGLVVTSGAAWLVTHPEQPR